MKEVTKTNTIKKTEGYRIFAALIVLSAIMTGCTLRPQTSSGQPNVYIDNIEANSQYPVGEPIKVEVVATDPASFGLSAVELKVNDEVVDSYQVPDKADKITVTLEFTPTEVGTVSLIAVAQRDNGMTGSSARLSIEIIEK